MDSPAKEKQPRVRKRGAKNVSPESRACLDVGSFDRLPLVRFGANAGFLQETFDPLRKRSDRVTGKTELGLFGKFPDLRLYDEHLAHE